MANYKNWSNSSNVIYVAEDGTTTSFDDVADNGLDYLTSRPVFSNVKQHIRFGSDPYSSWWEDLLEALKDTVDAAGDNLSEISSHIHVGGFPQSGYDHNDYDYNPPAGIEFGIKFTF